MKRDNSNSSFVYSTDPKYKPEEENSGAPQKNTKSRLLKISLDKKNRAGKAVTLISGYTGKPADLESLAKLLKNKCGTGGSAKDNEIILQGDKRKKVEDILKGEGYKVQMV